MMYPAPFPFYQKAAQNPVVKGVDISRALNAFLDPRYNAGE